MSAVTVRTPERKTALKLPARFQELKRMRGDPPLSVPCGYITEGTECFLTVLPVPREYAMPFGGRQAVIDGIRPELGEDQGLIEVENGLTRAQHRFIFSVVKTLKRMHGVQYTLTMHLELEDSVLQLQGFFSEGSAAGARDAMVFALLENRGEIRLTGNRLEGWVEDPYDPFFTRGTRMNRSEQAQYDDLFPEHPLSELRRFVREVIAEN